MKRLIRKNAQLYGAAQLGYEVNGYDYVECFINPSYSEFEAVKKIYRIKGFLTNDGTLYIFAGLITHSEAQSLFNIPPSLHLEFLQKDIGIYPEAGQDIEYIKNAFKNTTSLYNWVNENSIVDYIDTTIYKAPPNKLYKKIKTIGDIINLP